MTSNRRRRGQGMTEYIMLVGLIGILLVVAITRFKNQIQVTIEGSAGAVDDIGIGTGGEVSGAIAGGGRGTFKKNGSTYTRVPDDGGTYTKNGRGEFVRNP